MPIYEEIKKNNQRQAKFLIDKTTSALYQTILDEDYDVVIYDDMEASATAILQAARRDCRSILTSDTVYLNHEKEVKQSFGVIVLPLDFEHQSPKEVEGLRQILWAARVVRSFPVTAWMARRQGDGSWKLKRYKHDIDDANIAPSGIMEKLERYKHDIDDDNIAPSGIMDSSTWSNDEWLPQWTPDELVNKQFYYFTPGGNLPSTWPSEDNSDIYFPDSIKIHAVDNIETADFITVDDNTCPIEESYWQLLQSARGLKLPILKLSDVEFASWFIENHHHSSQSVQSLTPDIMVREYLDEENYLTLAFDENATIAEDDSADYRNHEILLRDPIVRSFTEKYEDSREHYSPFLSWSPLRIKNTRWKIDDVLEIYLSNAWFFADTEAVTCIRDWNEENFIKEYVMEFDAVKPIDAVHAALFVFYIANEEAVAKAKETAPPGRIDSDIHTELDPATKAKSMTVAAAMIAPNIQSESFTVTTFEKLQMGHAFTNRGELVNKQVFRINPQKLPAFDSFDRQSERDVTTPSGWAKRFIDNHMEVVSSDSYFHLFSVDSSYDKTSSPSKDVREPMNYRYFIRDIVKATISLKRENLVVAPAFTDAVKDAFYKTDTLNELRKVFDEYGYFWPASIHIGGKVVWSAEYSESANAFGRDFSIAVNKCIQKKVALFDGQQLTDVNNNIEPQSFHPAEELAHVIVKQKIYGGEESSGSYTIWSNSVNTDSTTWNTISRMDVIPIWRLLGDDLQNKINSLIANNEQFLVPINWVYQFQNLGVRNYLSWKNIYYDQKKKDEAGKIVFTGPILSYDGNSDTKWRIVRVKEDGNDKCLRYGDLVYIQPSISNTEYLHLSMDLRSPVTNAEGQLSLREIASLASIGENEQWFVERKDEYQDAGDRSPFVQKAEAFRLLSSARDLCLASCDKTMENVKVRRRHKGVLGSSHRLKNVRSIGLPHKCREVLVLKNDDITKDSERGANWIISDVGYIADIDMVSEVRADMVRILLDENVSDLVEALQSISGIDVDTVKQAGIQGHPLETAKVHQRILVTSETDFLASNQHFTQDTMPILILGGLLGSTKFTRLKKESKSKVINSLFLEQLEEIKSLGTGTVATAVLSGDQDNFMWVIRQPTEAEIFEIWKKKY